MSRWFFLLLLFGLSTLTRAETPPKTAPETAPKTTLVKASLTAGHYVSGEDLTVAIDLTPAEGWHIYWQNPGDSGLKTQLQWQLPQGFSAGEIQWQAPELFHFDGLVNYGYSGKARHVVTLQTPTNTPAFDLVVKAKWLVCKDICIPGEARLTQKVSEGRSATDPTLPVHPILTGSAQSDGQDIRLELPLANPAKDTFFFFPEADSLIEPSAAYRLETSANSLRMGFSKASSYIEPDSIKGWLWRVGSPDYWRIEADWGLVGKLPSSAQSLSPLALVGHAAANSTTNPTAKTPTLPLWQAWLGAFLGGLILNLMPCVFPVLALKAFSLAKAGRAQRLPALAYSAGVMVSMLALASVLLALRASGQQLGWGFQLQSPYLVAVLALLMLALGLWLSGVFHLGAGVMGLGQELTQKNGLWGSFFTGVLAVVVASPCSGPYMVVALGFALTQPALISLSIFALLALGLAAPFLLIGFIPALGRRLPKPGAWMDTFKQWLAFPLYATAVWLLWIAVRQAGDLALLWLGLAAVVLAMGLWALPKKAAWLLIVASFASVYWLPVSVPSKASSASTVPYSAQKLAELRQQGKTVFLDFTADWCATCKVNEKVAIDPVLPEFAQHNAVYMVGDWTNNDAAITAVLQQFNRAGVPLYVVYRGNAEADVLPQTLTPSLVRKAISSPHPQGS